MPPASGSETAPAARPLTFGMAVALVMGNMIGSGIFLLPASIAQYRGLTIAGWLLSTAGALALASVFARLSQLAPATGGPYVYVRRAFGDVPGFLIAWGYWISTWTSLGALAVALVGYLSVFIPSVANSPPAAAGAALLTLWVLVGVNVAGVRRAGWVQLVTTVLKVLPLVVMGAAAFLYFEPAHFAIPAAAPVAVAGTISSVVTLTLWAFLGLESCTVPAGSIERPAHTIPRATILGTLLASILYIASTIGVMSVLDPDLLARSPAPFADAARALAGGRAAQAIAAGAAVSCFGALNGWILLCGQLSAAVARDGLFPRIFARSSARGTPAAGIVIAGLLASALIALNYTRALVELFTFFILLATLSSLVPFAFCALAVFLLRDDRRPLTRLVSANAALAFAYALWAIGGAGQHTVYWGFLLLMSGLPVYVVMVRARRTMILEDGTGRGALEARLGTDAHEGQPVFPRRRRQGD